MTGGITSLVGFAQLEDRGTCDVLYHERLDNQDIHPLALYFSYCLELVMTYIKCGRAFGSARHVFVKVKFC